MFGLFRFKKASEQAALAHYQNAVARLRLPAFYQHYGVPDTMDGRFELLLIHLFPLIHAGVRANDPVFNQSLFDVTFHHLDQTLREMGIGDMGVPKHMKRMMKAFNGRMHVYGEAWHKQDLPHALQRNLYGTVEAPPEHQLSAVADYFSGLIVAAEQADFNDIKAGRDVYAAEPFQKYGT